MTVNGPFLPRPSRPSRPARLRNRSAALRLPSRRRTQRRRRRPLWRAVELAAVLVAAIVGSQVPVLIDRYQETLSGRVETARAHVDAIVDQARLAQVSVYELIDGAALVGGDPAASPDGPSAAGMRAQIDRAGWLDTARIRLANADMIERPVVVLAHFDQDVAADAWCGFSPAVSRPGPSLLFAALGAGLVLGVSFGLRRLLRSGRGGEDRAAAG